MMQEFERLSEIYTAIRDIDKIILSDSKDKLDDLNNAIKNIDKKKFDKSIENNIILSYRTALVKIYYSYIEELNSNINPNTITDEETSLKKISNESFGKMEDTTKEELTGIDPHIISNAIDDMKELEVKDQQMVYMANKKEAKR